MEQYKYTITSIEPESITQLDTISLADDNLISDFNINSSFDLSKDYIELHYYTLDGRLLLSVEDYKNARTTQDSETANGSTLNILSLQVEEDVINAGYVEGDINVIYNFLTDPYTLDSSRATFFIEEISSDRTEIRLLSVNLDDQFIIEKTADARLKLEDPSVGNLKINLGGDRLLLALNIDTLPYRENSSVVVKLYNPLPSDLDVKDTLNLVFEVSDPAAYNIKADLLTTTSPIKYLKGPNVTLEGDTDISFPSQYLNIQDLYSYAFTGSYYQLRSIFEEKGAELSIDHSNYSNFINFSSAEERLKNFKYKLDLITTYQSQLNSSTSYSGSILAYSGSAQYYESLINNILSNFDHYDRFLYYESSSFSWPKASNTKPYTLVTSSLTGSWYTDQLISASTYDYSNSNLLLNTVPTFIKDDPANAQYSLFVHMVAQHFDNIWLYAKGISEKYNADNRLTYGISKDLIQDALRNFGIKLYNSSRSTQELFKIFTGEFLDTGSAEIVEEFNHRTGSVEFINASDIAISEEDYRKQIYKRLYHNLPLLLKSKGTERGIRALLNSFGVPSLYSETSGSILNLLQFGGTLTSGSNLGNIYLVTSSLDKVRLDNTGSLVGTTLSQYTSIIKRDKKYSQDSNLLEVGFSPATYINNLILETGTLDGFNIDQIIGDPGYAFSSSYDELTVKAHQTLSGSIVDRYDLKDFTRLLRFYDNILFKTVKDFLPGRSNVGTGIIIKPHILERAKIPQVRNTAERHNEFSQSIDVAEISGKDGSSFGSNNQYSTSYTQYISVAVSGSSSLEPLLINSHEEPKYNGELSGSLIVITDGELNDENIYKYDRNIPISFKYNFIDADLDCDVIWGQWYPPASPTPTPTGTPTNTPTPTKSPIATPASTPGGTPAGTPASTPAVTPTPSNTPPNTPAGTPPGTPGGSPAVTPTSSVTPPNTPAGTPPGTPAGTPASTPAGTPASTPAGTPASTPVVTYYQFENCTTTEIVYIALGSAPGTDARFTDGSTFFRYLNYSTTLPGTVVTGLYDTGNTGCPAPPSPSPFPTPEISYTSGCVGGSGTLYISATASGGSGNYKYHLGTTPPNNTADSNDYNGTQSASNLANGTYFIYVIDLTYGTFDGTQSGFTCVDPTPTPTPTPTRTPVYCNSQDLGDSSIDGPTACTAFNNLDRTTRYLDDVFASATVMYRDDNCGPLFASAGWYSDGIEARYWDGTSFTGYYDCSGGA